MRALPALICLFLLFPSLPSLILSQAVATGPQIVTLEGGGWKVKDFDIRQGITLGVQTPQYDDSSWYSSVVPATAHKVLIDNGTMGDPLLHGASNYDWPRSREWWYRRSFSADAGWNGSYIRLHIKGVIERSDIYINGTYVGSTDGMYDETLFDISSYLSYGTDNLVAIRAYPNPNSDYTYRVSIAANEEWWKGFQYSKRLRPIGMWRGADLIISGPIWIRSTRVTTVGSLTATSTSATLHVKQSIVNDTGATQIVRVESKLEGQNFSILPITSSRTETIAPGLNVIEYDLNVSGSALKLWWPNGYGTSLPNGERYLYKLTTDVYHNDVLQSTQVIDHLGIRSLEFEYTTGADPATDYKYVYKINGERIYMQGGNWVPSDGVYRNPVMEANYEELLWLAKNAHFTMLRVWGGGIEEHPRFWQLASRYGICIMQEFWHKNVTYHPNETEWRANADDIVKRIRNYPALVKYTGGNELTGNSTGDRATAESLTYLQYVRDSYLTYDNSRGEFFATSPLAGSVHRWENLHMIGVEGYELAHGDPYQFLAELGMNAAPDEQTFVDYEGLDRAQKIWRSIGNEYIYPNEYGAYNDTAELARKTQLAQAIGMAYNVGWQKSHKWANAGALVWAYNDMAPMVGWGVVDFYNRPKAAYYYLKREFRPIHIRANYAKYFFDPGETFSVDVVAINDTPSPLLGYAAEAKLMELDGSVLAQSGATVDIAANADGGAVVALTASFTAPQDHSVFLLYVALKDAGGVKVADNLYWLTTEPNRSFYTLEQEAQKVALSVSDEVIDGQRVVHITNPSSAVAFHTEIRTPSYTRKSDNFFHLMPGESKDITLSVPAGSTYTGTYTIVPFQTEPGSNNLALFKPIYASQDDYFYRTGPDKHSDRKALYANDGDLLYTGKTSYSQWSAKTSGPAWIYVDLGTPSAISNVVLHWGAHYGIDYDIQVSNDAVNWTTVYTQSAGSGGIERISFPTVTARYVRFNGRSSSGSYDLREIEVFETAQPAPSYPHVADAIELERIPFASTSSDDSRINFDDNNMSYGAGAKLNANAAGDYITYKLDVQARTYQIKVGVKKQNTRGIFQLFINGYRQGSEQDTYAATDTYVELDLGRRTIRSGGTKEFQFKVTGKNESSAGYTLGLDYIRLIPLDYFAEAEALQAIVSSGDSHTIFNDANMSGGAGDKLNANGVGDFIEYTTSLSQSGEYVVKVGAKKHPSRGIFQLTIDGIEQGAKQDNYATMDSYVEFDLGTKSFATAGTKYFRFTITEKHVDSTGYTLGLDYIKLIPVDYFSEAEALSPVVSSGDSHTVFSDANMSGGAGDKLNADGVGDFIEYQLNVDRPGTYTVRVGAKKQDTRGIFQLSIGGANQDAEQDNYASSDSYVEFNLGSKTFTTAGTKTFRFTITGKNPSSLGYTLGLDYITLIAEP